MRSLQRTAICMAALCAAIGAECIVAFVSGISPQASMLVAANIAAAIGVVSLLASVLALVYATKRHFGIDAMSARECVRAAPGTVSSRNAVLERRLDVDEPRVCSQYAITCTCWSFCGGDADEHCAACAASPGEQGTASESGPYAQAHSLRVVQRSGKADCPFRYASPRAVRE